MAVRKISIPWLLLLAAVLIAAQSEAVGKMGGYVSGGSKTIGRTDSRSGRHRISSTSCCGESYCGRSCYGRRPEEISYYHRRRPEPTQPEETRYNHTGQPEPTQSSGDAVVFLVIFILILSFIAYDISNRRSDSGSETTDTTLMMIQAAVKNSSHEIQSDFSQFGKQLSPLDGEDMHLLEALLLLSETKSRILFHSDCCYAAFSSVDHIGKNRNWKRRFEQMCDEQMGKSDGRFVENSVGNLADEYVVVTILVAVGGDFKLPAINCLEDLKNAFSRLKSMNDHIKAVKVFWTPPNGRTKMLEDELFEEFPQLRPLDGQVNRTPTNNSRPRPSAPPLNVDYQPPHYKGLRDEQRERLNPLLDVD